MNIFVLDKNPVKAAEYHCNKHVVKMILEAGQMLCTAHWISWLGHLGKTRADFKLMRDVKEYLRQEVPIEKQPAWGITHVNHPCTIWTRQSVENYSWHLSLMRHLLAEYSKRYNRIHKAAPLQQWLTKNKPLSFHMQGLTPFAICMKDEYKVGIDPVASYRQYYIKDKVRFAKWEPHSTTPKWYKEMLNA